MDRQAPLAVPSAAPLAQAPRQISSLTPPHQAPREARGLALGLIISGYTRREEGLRGALGFIDTGGNMLVGFFYKLVLYERETLPSLMAGRIKPEGECRFVGWHAVGSIV